jgi:hypothetical protein
MGAMPRVGEGRVRVGRGKVGVSMASGMGRRGEQGTGSFGERGEAMLMLGCR